MFIRHLIYPDAIIEMSRGNRYYCHKYLLQPKTPKIIIISNGLKSVAFLKFDQVLQRRFHKILIPVVQFLLYEASKQTASLSKFRSQIFFTGECAISQDLSESAKNKPIYTVNSNDIICPMERCNVDYVNKEILSFFYLNHCKMLNCTFRDLSMIPTLFHEGLESVFVSIKAIRQDLFYNIKDFEILIKAVSRLPNLESIYFQDVDFPNGWETIFIKYLADKIWKEIIIEFQYWVNGKISVNFSSELCHFISKQKSLKEFAVDTDSCSCFYNIHPDFDYIEVDYPINFNHDHFKPSLTLRLEDTTWECVPKKS